MFRKGELTQRAIVDQALYLACRVGLEALSFGSLAKQMQMSKSGIFSRFNSAQALQIEVIREYRRRFEKQVFYPGIAAPSVLPRLLAMFFHWTRHVTDSSGNGCFYISCAIEYASRSGAIRDELLAGAAAWREALVTCAQSAIKAGHLHCDSDAEQIVHEMYGLVLALHHNARFVRDPHSDMRAVHAFRRLIDGLQAASYESIYIPPYIACRR
jgi:AcrR family transcriptional regulator